MKSLDRIRSVWHLFGSSVTVALIVAGVLVTKTRITTQWELKQQLTSFESLKATENVALANFAKASDEIQQLRQQDVQRRERSSPQHDETAFLEWVNNRSKESKLDVRDFRPSNRETQGDYNSRTVVLSAQGSYESICLFLDSLRQCPYMLRVTSLEILPQDQNRATFGATFNILLFTAQPPQASSSAKQG